MLPKTPFMKALVGNQHRLPEHLKKAILAAPAKSYGKSPIKKEKDSDKLFNKDETGRVTGIVGTPTSGGVRNSYTPEAGRQKKIKSKAKKGELPKYENYKGGIVYGKNDVIRGFKDDKGTFTKFTNPAQRKSLTKTQQKQLQSFEKTMNTYNTKQAENRRFQKALVEYPETGKMGKRSSAKKTPIKSYGKKTPIKKAGCYKK